VVRLLWKGYLSVKERTTTDERKGGKKTRRRLRIGSGLSARKHKELKLLEVEESFI